MPTGVSRGANAWVKGSHSLGYLKSRVPGKSEVTKVTPVDKKKIRVSARDILMGPHKKRPGKKTLGSLAPSGNQPFAPSNPSLSKQYPQWAAPGADFPHIHS